MNSTVARLYRIMLDGRAKKIIECHYFDKTCLLISLTHENFIGDMFYKDYDTIVLDCEEYW